MSESDQENKILEALRLKGGELSTKNVAELAKMSPNVASKYLGLLKKDGKVTLREQKPYRFWKLTEEKAKKESK